MRKILAASLAIASMAIAAWFAFSPQQSPEQLEPDVVSVSAKSEAATSLASASASAPASTAPKSATRTTTTSPKEESSDEQHLPQKQPEMAPGVPVPTVGNRNPYIEAGITPAEARKIRNLHGRFKQFETQLQYKESNGEITPEQLAIERGKLMDSMEEEFVGLLGQERADIFAEATAAWAESMVTAMRKDFRGEEAIPEEIRPKGKQ